MGRQGEGGAMDGQRVKLIVCGMSVGGVVALAGFEVGAQRETGRAGERPALKRHLDQGDVEI